MAHAQKPDLVFRWNGRVHLNRRGRQFSRLLAAEVCASAVVMLDTPCSEVVWRVLATHSVRQFPLHLPYRASPCAITFLTGLYHAIVLTHASNYRRLSERHAKHFKPHFTGFRRGCSVIELIIRHATASGQVQGQRLAPSPGPTRNVACSPSSLNAETDRNARTVPLRQQTVYKYQSHLLSWTHELHVRVYDRLNPLSSSHVTLPMN